MSVKYQVFCAIAFALLIVGVTYIDANTPIQPTQPTRGELIAPLLEPHRLETDGKVLKSICKSVGGSPEVLLEWVYEGKLVKTVVPCEFVIFVSGGEIPSVTFGFHSDWINGVPEYLTFSQGEEDIVYMYSGELKKYDYENGGGNAAVMKKDGVVVYRPEILADPNNFLDRDWLESVVITTPE